MNKKGYIIIGILIVLVIVAILGSVYFSKKKEEKRDYELLNVTEYTYLPLEVDGKYGIIKKDGTVIIEPKYDEVQIPNQDRDIFIVKEEENYSVLNENNEKIYANYEQISAIEGTSSTNTTIYNNTVMKYKENDKYGLIDLDGNKITEAQYEEMSSLDGKYGEILVKKDGKLGVINVKGIELVKCKYDYIKGDGYNIDGSYKNGGYIIGNKSSQGYVYGYIDKDEKEIIKMEQESIDRVTELQTDDVYLIVSKNGRFALYKNDENITDYKYINIYFNTGTETFIVQKNKTYGLMKLDGTVVIPEQYQELMVVGIFVKATKDDVNYTFDLEGNQIENSQFVSLQNTSTGKLYISIDDNYKYGIADKEKNVLVENKYDYIYEIEKSGILIANKGNDITIFSGSGKEIVSVENAKLEMIGDYIQVTTPDELYYLTVDGKKVDNKTVYLDNKIYASKQGGKWGFVDLKDNVIVPYEYDEVTEVNKYGFAGIKKDGKWGIINADGEVILEPTYESDEINPNFLGQYYLKDGIARNYIY